MMTPRFSYHLDLLRFLAAFIVLISHFAYPRFTQGDFSFVRDYNLGSDAVVVFFVLSGFVISFAAVEKDKTAGCFAFSRLTRLYSVAIPALLLTLLCDKLGFFIDASHYQAPYYALQSSGDFWLKGLTFSTHWTDEFMRLGTNGPYWSLSYEAAYYLLFAILMFARGSLRIIALALTVLIIGVKVMLLLPAWAMGAGLYFLLQRLKNYNPSSVLLGMMMVPALLYIFCLSAELPEFLYSLCQSYIPAQILSQAGFSDEFLWNAILGALFSIHLLGAALWMRQKTVSPRSHRVVKWLAGASFSLYLVHYPVLTLTKAAVPSTGISALDHIILLAITLIVCFIFAEMFERPLYKFRSWIKKLPALWRGRRLKFRYNDKAL